jgi:hypothetical protein
MCYPSALSQPPYALQEFQRPALESFEAIALFIAGLSKMRVEADIVTSG